MTAKQISFYDAMNIVEMLQHSTDNHRTDDYHSYEYVASNGLKITAGSDGHRYSAFFEDTPKMNIRYDRFYSYVCLDKMEVDLNFSIVGEESPTYAHIFEIAELTYPFVHDRREGTKTWDVRA